MPTTRIMGCTFYMGGKFSLDSYVSRCGELEASVPTRIMRGILSLDSYVSRCGELEA